jgi:hypothetical protein
MSRRSVLSTAERDSLLALPGHPDTRTPGHPDTRTPGHPDTRDDLIRYYTFSDTLAIIRQRRGPENRLRVLAYV